MTRIRGFVALLGFLRLNFRFRGKLYDIVIRGVVSLYGEKVKRKIIGCQRLRLSLFVKYTNLMARVTSVFLDY